MAAAAGSGVFTVSLDFELHWGVLDHRSIDRYREHLLGARTAIPKLLKLFEAYGVHATWATVGMLFCRTRGELEAAAPSVQPEYLDAKLSPYAALAEVGDNEAADPFHFGAELLERIRGCPGQEVGSQTFSHYYCLEPGQTLAAFRADLAAAKLVAEHRGLELRSLVFPRNQVNPDYLAACAEAGFTCYRSQPGHWLYQPSKRSEESLPRRGLRFLDAHLPLSGHNAAPWPTGGDGGLIALPASRFLRPFSPTLAGLRLRRITASLEVAARHGLVYHLWWHPHNFGTHQEQNLAFLRRILDRFRALQQSHGMVGLNMGELAEAARRA
jgi:peptidoglycan/xylan/chitin deacetylase (PgdA/CDA1 family)